MKRILYLVSILWFTTATGQDLTGIWAGTFYTNRLEMVYGSNNRYEVQIDNVGRMVKGVTYSYQTNSFFGKSSIVGMWTPGTKNIIFKEDKLLDYRNADSNTVGMFTCYLEYRKDGDKEILEGDYTSTMYKSNKDAGSGKIYLERTTVSAFKKEDFVIRKEKELAKKQPETNTIEPKTIPIKPKLSLSKPDVAESTKQQPKPVKPNVVAEAQPLPKPVKPTVAKPKPVAPPVKKQVAAAPPKITKPKTEVAKQAPEVAKQAPEVAKVDPPKIAKTDAPKKASPPPAQVDLPKVLKERTNELFKTIPVSANEIEVNFYDNGEIDGDTISIYLNGRQIGSHRGLSTVPITFKIKIDEDNPDQEIVMVAENLGTIPPNTALMIVKAGDKRYDVNLSSSEQKNAMVRFKYQKE